MKTALFGGTFDPIHRGHLKAAQAAVRRFGLDRVLFIPSSHPPHKPRAPLTPFIHRYTMVALACASHPRFIPSPLEAPTPARKVFYSVDTVLGVVRERKQDDRPYFLIGVDAFLDIQTWHRWRQLFRLVNFIVISRPGFPLGKIRETLPLDLLGGPWPPAKMKMPQNIELKSSTMYLVDGVRESVSARAIREAARQGRSLRGLVPPAVNDYIQKERLYI